MTARERVLELIRRDVTTAAYDEIRDLWKRHSLAEEQRNIAGLLSTLTEDCIYEILGTEYRWQGHDGATRFYVELLTAFPDVDFRLTDIVIGPQGVSEEAILTATHERDWLDYPASGRQLELAAVIFFPWDTERRRFRGEKIYVDARSLAFRGTM